MTTGDEAARAATRRDDLRRRLAAPSGRGRKLRGLVVLLAPYRTRVVLMFVALVAGTAASLAPAPLAKAGHRLGHPQGRSARRSTSWSSPSSPARSWSGRRRTRRPTSSAGSASARCADLRLQIFRHLQEQPVGFYERRPAGMLISRMTNDVEALDSLVTDTWSRSSRPR